MSAHASSSSCWSLPHTLACWLKSPGCIIIIIIERDSDIFLLPALYNKRRALVPSGGNMSSGGKTESSPWINIYKTLMRIRGIFFELFHFRVICWAHALDPPEKHTTRGDGRSRYKNNRRASARLWRRVDKTCRHRSTALGQQQEEHNSFTPSPLLSSSGGPPTEPRTDMRARALVKHFFFLFAKVAIKLYDNVLYLLLL